jgi:DNA-directed RNA polymerase subunit RPC12/RpoP
MNKIVRYAIAFVALFLLFLGLVFLMAYEDGLENIMIGGVMILLALGMLAFVYYDSRLEAKRPVVVEQTYNVRIEGSGELGQKPMKCQSCNAPVGEKDVKVIEGGLMYTCPYCGSVGALEEEPKW